MSFLVIYKHKNFPVFHPLQRNSFNQQNLLLKTKVNMRRIPIKRWRQSLIKIVYLLYSEIQHYDWLTHFIYLETIDSLWYPSLDSQNHPDIYRAKSMLWEHSSLRDSYDFHHGRPFWLSTQMSHREEYSHSVDFAQ